MSNAMGNSEEKFEFRLVSIEATDPPEGMPGTIWHRYIIQRGQSIIEGIQPGQLKDVTDHAKDYVETLNERLSSGSYAYGSRKRK